MPHGWKFQAFILILSVLILLMPGLKGFPFPSTNAQYSDLATTHFPNAVFIHQSLFVDKQIPLWSPLLYSGYPFFAHPLSGLWYPPGWLAWFFPTPACFNLLVIIHILWGSWGMVNYLKSLGFSMPTVWFGAFGFALMPKIYAHYGAGHLTLIYAIVWLPWLLWSVRSEKGRFSWLSSLFWALTFLADVRWGVYAGLMWVAYYFYTRWLSLDYLRFHNIFQSAALFVLKGLVALGLTAPFLIPLLELTGQSNRTDLGLHDFFAFSFPPSHLLSFFFPNLGGFHEWIVYGGSVAVILVLSTWLIWKPDGNTKFWSTIFIFSILFSLGNNLPGAEWIASLPGLSLLRVPARVLFLTQFSMIMLACQAIQRFQEYVPEKSTRRLFLLMFGLIVFIIFFWIGIYLVDKSLSVNFLWGGACLGVGMTWIGFALWKSRENSIWRQYLVNGVLLICLIDWIFVDRSLFLTKPIQQVIVSEKAAGFFEQQDGEFRLYSPSYSLPQQTGAIYALEFASGVDPVQLKSYVNFMRTATGVPGKGYDVSIPAFATGNPERDNRNFRPDTQRLGLLNVRYVLSSFPLDSIGLIERWFEEGIYIYENQFFRPRAWVEQGDKVVSSAKILDHSNPSHISVQAEGPGLLVLSEVIYPGWQVRIDGQRAEILAYQGLLRAVDLPEGSHQVQFDFRPSSLYQGICGFSFTIIAILVYSLIYPKKEELSDCLNSSNL